VSDKSVNTDGNSPSGKRRRSEARHAAPEHDEAVPEPSAWARPGSAAAAPPPPTGEWADLKPLDELTDETGVARVSPWPELESDERSTALPARHSDRRWGQVAAAAVFVACLGSIGGGIFAWNQFDRQPPLGAAGPPPPPPPPPMLRSAPALPDAIPPELTPSARPPASPSPGAAAVQPEPSGSAAAPLQPQGSPARPADGLAAWAAKLSRVDIPPVALQAYGYAETVLATTRPKCHLSWTVLAGIGAVESDHGRYHAELQPDGTSLPPIIGVPLAGIGTERVGDTDHGALDGDRNVDRAIGPMQFLPGTWKAWAADADGDGKANPYDIDDAALSAANYLCAGDGDLATGAGWSAAVFSYNHIPAYVERVYNFADAYGRAS
jgi:hypothetical protein